MGHPLAGPRAFGGEGSVGFWQVVQAYGTLGGTDWGVLQAGVTISIVPCVLFYLLLQRYYVAGLTSGAVK